MQETVDVSSLIKINKIIERERKSSTYKLALLKATILAVQRYDHLIKVEKGEKATIPLGLIVEDWFFTYLPFVFENVSQQNNKRVLNKQIEEEYWKIFNTLHLKDNWKESYAAIFNLYHSEEKLNLFVPLFKKLARTIISNPMKYSGEREYEIFKPKALNQKFAFPKKSISRKDLIFGFGEFSIPFSFYLVFRYLGQSLYGLTTITQKWREITFKLNDEARKDKIEEFLVTDFLAQRDTSMVRKLLPPNVFCVWSDKKIRKFDIDHLLPYSIWFSNDLWNLLPASPDLNRKKSDKIPSPELIERKKDNIIYYWERYKALKKNIFTVQREIALGKRKSEEKYVAALCEKADYLINERGLEPWDPKI